MPKLVISISEISELEFNIELEAENMNAEACYRIATAVKDKAMKELMNLYTTLKGKSKILTPKGIEAMIQHRQILQEKVDSGELDLGEINKLKKRIIELENKIKKLNNLRSIIIADKGEELKRLVADIYGVNMEDITGKNRTTPLPECRQLIAYMLQDICTRNEIAEILSYDRTSLYHAIENFGFLLSFSKQTRQRYDTILQLICT